MPSRRLRGDNLPAASGTRPGGLAGAGATRPRARGMDSGRVSAQERPAVLGRGEEDEGSHSSAEAGQQGGRRSASRLKATVLISEVLALYGARLDFSAKWRSIHCPFHADRTASASYNDTIGQFYCHGCEVHGDIFDIVQWAEGISFPEAVAFIEKEFIR